jgi:hypothetical protein
LTIATWAFSKSFAPDCKMSDELNEIQADVTNGQSAKIASDEAFCIRMRWAIEAGLESAPIGVVATPSTRNPKYVATEPRPVASRDMDWVKVKNPNAPAVKREAEEDWGRGNGG